MPASTSDARRELPLEPGRGRGGQVDSGADPRRQSPAEGDGGERGTRVGVRGDLTARDFADEDVEAAWICDRIEAMRGLHSTIRPTTRRGACRGRTSPCCSDLSRGCRPAGRGDAPARHPVLRQRPESPLRQPGDHRRCRSVSLHGRPRRAVRIYDFSGRDANLLPANGDWAAALAVLDEGRDFDRGERWGVYNIQRLYSSFLAALGVRGGDSSG